LAGEYLRVHAEEFAPFLGLLPSDSDYEEYCRKVTSVGDAEWGGQLEIKALCSCLNRTMLIFSADSPVLKMGDEEGKDCSRIPLKLAYHRHFYALGEHYNSVAPVIKPCSCSIDEHTTP
jgi:OTU domain-containing protein 6